MRANGLVDCNLGIRQVGFRLKCSLDILSPCVELLLIPCSDENSSIREMGTRKKSFIPETCQRVLEAQATRPPGLRPVHSGYLPMSDAQPCLILLSSGLVQGRHNCHNNNCHNTWAPCCLPQRDTVHLAYLPWCACTTVVCS